MKYISQNICKVAQRDKMHVTDSFFLTFRLSQLLGLSPYRAVKYRNDFQFRKSLPFQIYSAILTLFTFLILLKFMLVVWDGGNMGNIHQKDLFSKWLPLFLDHFASVTTSGFCGLFFMIYLHPFIKALNLTVNISNEILIPNNIKQLRYFNITIAVSGILMVLNMSLILLITNPFKSSHIYAQFAFCFMSEIFPLTYICHFSSIVLLIGCCYSEFKNVLLIAKKKMTVIRNGRRYVSFI